uniref:Uncharacterized protein n=1 Tax=Arundo donax TaxID=35708 RepID=A0A0A9CSQ0_ARUDO
MREMLSGEISATCVTKLNAVNDGGGPRGSLGGSGIASRSQTGATDGAGSPRASSPAAFRNCAAPWPSNTRWLKQIPTENPPQVNFVTWAMRMRSSSFSSGGGRGRSSSLGMSSGRSRPFTSASAQLAAASTNQTPSPVQSTTGSPGLGSAMRPATG